MKSKGESRRGVTSARYASRIVAIGGSAGSLDAVVAIIASLPGRTGAAFVVVTHRDPRTEELMPAILAAHTALPVRVAAHGEAVLPDVVYVIPSGSRVSLRGRRFDLTAKAKQVRSRTPSGIDALFEAVASSYGASAIAVLLSGMGSDGARGIAAVAERGGVALAQSAESSAYDSMPRAAIATERVAIVGAPEMLASAILRELGVASERADGKKAAPRDVEVEAILRVLGLRTGHDFSQYKRSTVARRIERRMGVLRLADIKQYRKVVEEDPREVQLLFDDLLIGVTRFFRDPNVFEALARDALPAVFERHTGDRPVRVWVAGCATGEEAYSIAILLHEHRESMPAGRAASLQIYATDLDEGAIAVARQGLYPTSIETDVSRERLDRYFTREAAGYRVRKQIRESVIFAAHNIISDPPFTRLDLLLCRNVLIYLDADLQRRVLPLFAYALVPGGVLVLGTSETIGDVEDRFRPIDAKLKIFRRVPVEADRRVEFPLAPRKRTRASTAPAITGSIAELVDRVIVDRLAPPVVLVDASGNLLFATQRIARFFEAPVGKATYNVLAMARGGLAAHLRTALRRAAKRGARVDVRGIALGRRSAPQIVDLVVVPLREPAALAGSFLVAVREHGAARAKATPVTAASGKKEIARLEQELRETVAEMERSQGELYGMNEELQSTNEELQSTNEELTTSKEEMQSMNEELLTLNAELQAKNDALATVNDDMRNLLNASQIPTLFLDNSLRLKRYTAHATRIANLIATDVGRPITDIRLNVDYPALTRDVREVLATLVFKEVEVRGREGVFMVRIHPYRTIDDVIDGVVMTFHDVTAERTAARGLEAERLGAVLERLVGEWPGAAYVEDSATGRTLAVSARSGEIFGCDPSVLARGGADAWRALRHADDRDVDGGRPFRLRVKDGSYASFVDDTSVLTRSVATRPGLVLHVLSESAR